MSGRTDDPYLSGRALWGDDFGPDEVAAWFEDEREAYAVELGGAEGGAENDFYSALNERHAFRHLPRHARFPRALGLGSAFGAEFLPIIDRIDEVTIVEASQRMRVPDLRGRPLSYRDPDPSGDLPFGDETFDLVLAFSVLHHIPNVSHVVRELGRVVKRDGFVLLREPVISMGDWRQQRKPGVTSRERGIPRHLLHRFVADAGLVVTHEALCAFPTTGRLGQRWPRLSFGDPLGVRIDELLSAMTARNLRYHATHPWQKVRPTATTLVTRRREGARP